MGQARSYNHYVELVSNLVWLLVSVTLLGVTYCGVRRGTIRLSMRLALMLALLICLILLPAISISDDLMAAQQAALPLASQTWRMVSEGSSAELGALLAGLYLLLMMCLVMIEAEAVVRAEWTIRPLAERLARNQHLRPPPCAAY